MTTEKSSLYKKLTLLQYTIRSVKFMHAMVTHLSCSNKQLLTMFPKPQHKHDGDNRDAQNYTSKCHIEKRIW